MIKNACKAGVKNLTSIDLKKIKNLTSYCYNKSVGAKNLPQLCILPSKPIQLQCGSFLSRRAAKMWYEDEATLNSIGKA